MVYFASMTLHFHVIIKNNADALTLNHDSASKSMPSVKLQDGSRNSTI